MKTFAKILRVIGIVLVGLTTVITILSGIGTTCVAWGAENYDSMAALVPYKPLYQTIVVVTLLVGIAAVVMTVGLIRRTQWSYTGTVLTLLVGIVIGGIHVYYSQTLRGSAAPGNVRFYLSILTLVVVAILRLPGIWKHITLDEPTPDTWRASTGLAAIVAGVAMLTTPLWAGPTHLLDGYQWVNVLRMPLLVAGGALLLGGLIIVLAGSGSLRQAHKLDLPMPRI